MLGGREEVLVELVGVPVAGEDVLKVNPMHLTAYWADHGFSWERVEATLHEVFRLQAFSEDKNCQFFHIFTFIFISNK